MGTTDTSYRERRALLRSAGDRIAGGMSVASEDLVRGHLSNVASLTSRMEVEWVITRVIVFNAKSGFDVRKYAKFGDAMSN